MVSATAHSSPDLPGHQLGTGHPGGGARPPLMLRERRPVDPALLLSRHQREGAVGNLQSCNLILDWGAGTTLVSARAAAEDP